MSCEELARTRLGTLAYKRVSGIIGIKTFTKHPRIQTLLHTLITDLIAGFFVDLPCTSPHRLRINLRNDLARWDWNIAKPFTSNHEM